MADLKTQNTPFFTAVRYGMEAHAIGPSQIYDQCHSGWPLLGLVRGVGVEHPGARLDASARIVSAGVILPSTDSALEATRMKAVPVMLPHGQKGLSAGRRLRPRMVCAGAWPSPWPPVAWPSRRRVP